MHHRSDEIYAPKTSELVPAHRSIAPEPDVTQPSQPNPLSRVAPGAGGAPLAQAQAAALNRASGGQLSRTGPALLQLQRQQGNRHVQRVVSHAREGGHVAPAQEGNRTGLPDRLKAGIETLSGLSLDDVRVHYNSSKPAGFQALAYTQGTDIHVGPGQEKHLAHEAWHVVQQKQGRVQPTMQAEGVAINDDAALEKEADVMGRHASRGGWANMLTDSKGGCGSLQEKPSLTPFALSGEIIQRRIGFEIETGIPMTKREVLPSGQGVWNNLDPDDVSIGTGSRAKLSVDHIPGKPAHAATATERFDEWPIVELVTDPIEDNLTSAAFRVIANQWVADLLYVRGVAQASPPPSPVVKDFYVGLPSAQGYNDWDRIAPQATIGLPLDQVPTLLKKLASELTGKKSAVVAQQIGARAPSVAAGIMQDIFGRHPPSAGDGPGVAGLKGLLTMVCHLLMIGGDDDVAMAGYLKNRPATVMYKTKLSTIRDNICHEPYPKKILWKLAERKWLRDQLRNATGRTSGEPVFKAGATGTAASVVTVGDWLIDVTSGTDDTLFDEMKNPWSDEITPDARDEVVMELRSLNKFVPLPNALTPAKANGIVDYLVSVYMTHRALKERLL